MFDSGKSSIRTVSNAKLEEIVKVMNEYKATNFILEGYTDNTGIAAKNLQLSKERAAAVKNYLIAKGISADRLTSEGYGIVKPIASNKTATGRAENRRVEIILVK
ncbi:outer membrane protein OmpA-like peptidoglycan-associated protein [Flavobacterium sp. 7A]|nr:outer membrane protein OmpA-like peptidoglycan-associated protein [Flavobacterium sp. 7A]